MSDGFMLTGEISVRVFDFLRTRSAIGLEMKGLKMGQGSALKAARVKGYVPEALARRRKSAYGYMSYVAELLTNGKGSFPTLYAEEIVMGRLVYSDNDKCGCPTFEAAKDKTNRMGLLPYEQATMCIGHEEG